MQTATVDGVELFVKLLYIEMPRAQYDQLPDRQGMSGLPIDGVTYKDSAFPNAVFRCHAGQDWNRYGYTAFSARLTDG